MDGPRFNTIDGLPWQKQLEKTIIRFTRFQIVLAVIQLVAVCMDLLSTPGMTLFSLLASVLLAPVFIGSVIVEILSIIAIKAGHRSNNIETQNYSLAGAYYSGSNEGVGTPDQSHQAKRLRPSVKALIALFSILGITGLLATGNVFLPRYFAISDMFSREEKALNNGVYHVEIIKKDPSSGIMTGRLDNDISFDYTCKVNPVGIDSGYGPRCSYHFADGSYGLGEYIFRKNYSDFQKLLTKYRDALVADNAIYIFNVKDQEEMEPFFSELMQNADFNKAYKAFKALKGDKSTISGDLDYIYIRNVEYEGRKYGGIGLFEWADYTGFEP